MEMIIKEKKNEIRRWWQPEYLTRDKLLTWKFKWKMFGWFLTKFLLFHSTVFGFCMHKFRSLSCELILGGFRFPFCFIQYFEFNWSHWELMIQTPPEKLPNEIYFETTDLVTKAIKKTLISIESKNTNYCPFMVVVTNQKNAIIIYLTCKT